jgi:hypothetical protein
MSWQSEAAAQVETNHKLMILKTVGATTRIVPMLKPTSSSSDVQFPIWLRLLSSGSSSLSRSGDAGIAASVAHSGPASDEKPSI